MSNRETFWIDPCTRMAETDAAVLVELEDSDRIWFPLSQVESMHFNSRGEGKMLVTAWIAKQKGLI